MKTRTLFAALLASAFVLPFAANAGGNKDHGGKSASTGTSTSTNDVSAQATFKSMDKDGDGFISKAESAGSSNDAQFTQFDKNSDGRLSSAEYANGSANSAARTQTQGSAASPSTLPSSASTTSSAKVN